MPGDQALAPALEELVTRTSRTIAAAALATIPLLILSGCGIGGIGGGAKPVDFEDLQSAVIQIQAQGTFVEPGTLEPSETAGRGSGFLISDSGIAVTNNHVVVGAGTLKVWLGGDTSEQYDAKVLGASECLDLAVIQLDQGTYPFLAWHEGEIKPALDVYSAGFPLGDPNFTLTKGIVSKADVPQDGPWASLDHVIEHDARIRGGNSGGPLVDPNGRVVGVNYAGEDELDYNFAIHRDQVLPYLDDLTKGERVLSLGVNAQSLPTNEDGSPNGIWVSSLEAGGPADDAGLEPGDMLIDLAGITMGADGTLEDYCQVLETQGVDGTMDVTIYRPATDEIWAGQINGDELELVGTGGGGGDVVESFVDVTDDAGIVSVKVPNTWSDVSSNPFTDDTGANWYSVSASPDFAGYQSDISVPGVTVSASDESTLSPEAALAELSSGADSICTPLDVSVPYDDGYYVGVASYWTDCGGTSTDYLVLTALSTSGTHLIFVNAQLVSEFDQSTVLENILASFQAAL
jgi:serine protease Do